MRILAMRLATQACGRSTRRTPVNRLAWLERLLGNVVPDVSGLSVTPDWQRCACSRR
jgi:hypothetical protein